jgi:hypothetical protein
MSKAQILRCLSLAFKYSYERPLSLVEFRDEIYCFSEVIPLLVTFEELWGFGDDKKACDN